MSRGKYSTVTRRLVKHRRRVFWNSAAQGTYMKPETVARKQAERSELARLRAQRKKRSSNRKARAKRAAVGRTNSG